MYFTGRVMLYFASAIIGLKENKDLMNSICFVLISTERTNKY